MQRKAKVFLTGLGGLLTFAWLASRAKAAPPAPPEGPSAGASVAIYDMDGNLVPQNSPATLGAGAWYTARITVTNTSLQGGVGVGATLLSGVVVTIAGTRILDPGARLDFFAANETKSFDWVFYIDAGSAGATGSLTGSVFSPALDLLNTAVEPITVVAAPIIYGATMTVGVV